MPFHHDTHLLHRLLHKSCRAKNPLSDLVSGLEGFKDVLITMANISPSKLDKRIYQYGRSKDNPGHIPALGNPLLQVMFEIVLARDDGRKRHRG